MIILHFHLQPQFKYELFHILHNITKSHENVIILQNKIVINISNTVSVLFPLHHNIIEKHIYDYQTTEATTWKIGMFNSIKTAPIQ